MRQIGNLDRDEFARQFADFLVANDIPAHSEADGEDRWAVWVRNEDQCDRARELLEQFKTDPQHERYAGATAMARERVRTQRRANREVARNVIDIRQRWSAGAVRATPLVLAICVTCVIIALLTLGGSFESLRRILYFTTSQVGDPWQDIRQGQVWRLVTPALLHADGSMLLMHLLFNLYWLVALGGPIERLCGPYFLGGLFVILAAISSVIQATLDNPYFVGMSGVNYGLFGFVWMKARFDPWSGFMMHRNTVVLLLGWFVLCYVGVIQGVANTAHAAGLVAGIVLGYASAHLRWGRNRKV